MKSFWLIWLVVALTQVALAQGHSQPQPLSKSKIEVAGATLRLGMTKGQVAEKLTGHDISKLNEDEWMINSEKHSGPLVQFHNGVLTYADRIWTVGDDDVTQALFGAVSAFNDEGLSLCKVAADTSPVPGMNAQRVWIKCGEKSILLIRRFIGGHSFDEVDEQLGVLDVSK